MEVWPSYSDHRLQSSVVPLKFSSFLNCKSMSKIAAAITEFLSTAVKICQHIITYFLLKFYRALIKGFNNFDCWCSSSDRNLISLQYHYLINHPAYENKGNDH